MESSHSRLALQLFRLLSSTWTPPLTCISLNLCFHGSCFDSSFGSTCPGLCILQVSPYLLVLSHQAPWTSTNPGGEEGPVVPCCLLTPHHSSLWSQGPAQHASDSLLCAIPVESMCSSSFLHYEVFSTPSVIFAPLYFYSCSSLGLECTLPSHSTPEKILPLPQAHLK